ncbi:MAG: glycosyltransferase [Thermomicrobiales bacterium]
METPESPHALFSVARRHHDNGELGDALRAYERRAACGDAGEEVWYSRYRIGDLRERLGHPWGEVLEAYLASYQLDPARAEPLYRIGVHYQTVGEYALAHLFLARVMALPAPASLAETEIYDSYGPLQYAISCYYVGEHAEAIRVNNGLLSGRKLAPELRERVMANRRFSLDAIHPPSPGPRIAPRRIVVCIPCQGPATTLYDCLHSLLLQAWTEFDAVLIDRGAAVEATMLPDGDPRFRVIRYEASTDWGECIARFLGEECDADDVVMMLSPDEQLAHVDVLGTIRDAFHDPDCRVVYGQYRLATGQLGDAESAPDEGTFVGKGGDLRGRSTLAFRAGMGIELAVSPPHGNIGALMDGIQRAAGFHRTRFLDDTMTVVSEPSSPRPPAPRIQPLCPLTHPKASPSVSCLMITHERLPLVEQAIRCYGDQTYPNRELVIVTTGGTYFRRALERYIEREHIPDVRITQCEDADATLGRLRNISLDAATGDVVCQWDDDDLYHPTRLAVQLDRMLEDDARACFLTDHLQFLEETRRLGWTDWTFEGAIEGVDTLLPGTLMMFKDGRFRYPETGQFSGRGEDTALLDDLHRAVRITGLSEKGYLYVYRHHGRNTFSREHHYRMFNCGMSADYFRRHEAELREALRYYPLIRPLTVIGRDGPVFAVQD